jgi:hypothetical protein
MRRLLAGLAVLAAAAPLPFEPEEALLALDDLPAGWAEDPDEDDGDEFRLAPSSFPEVGEESVPILVPADVDGVTISFYVVAIRVADGVAQVGYGGLDPDVAEAARFARLAAGKLAAAQE